MKRSLVFAAGILILMLSDPGTASATCQSCPGMGSMSAMCWTLTNCERGATMSACVVKERTDSNGNVTSLYCDGFGTTAGSDCNGNDISCANGGGGPGAGGGGGGGGACTISGGEVCPADCSSCSIEDMYGWW
jgi:hypothetical protein